MKAIYEYPEKSITVADIVRLTGATDLKCKIIIQETDDVLFKGDMKSLAYRPNGFAHKMCGLKVWLLCVSNDGAVEIYV